MCVFTTPACLPQTMVVCIVFLFRLYTLMKKDMLASKEREERMRKQNAAFQKRMDSLGKVSTMPLPIHT